MKRIERKRRIGEKAAIVSILLISEARKRHALPTPTQITNQSHFGDTSGFYKSQTYKIKFQFPRP